MLRHQPHGQPLTAEEIDARDLHVRQAYRQQRDQLAGPDGRRRNQSCWLCAERRTCHPAPAPGWECDHCQTLQ